MQGHASKWIVGYIHHNSISIQQISEVLGIPVQKLDLNASENLEADEFLKLCAYLGIRPENIPLEWDRL